MRRFLKQHDFRELKYTAKCFDKRMKVSPKRWRPEMGGSGGGGPFIYRSPQELAKLVRKAEDETAAAAFETQVSNTLNDLLSEFNNRDVQLVGQRLNDIKLALENE
jgi:hypothetical protein